MSGGHGNEEHGGHDDHHSAPSGGGGWESLVKNPVGFGVGMAWATGGVMWWIGKLIGAIFRK